MFFLVCPLRLYGAIYLHNIFKYQQTNFILILCVWFLISQLTRISGFTSNSLFSMHGNHTLRASSHQSDGRDN